MWFMEVTPRKQMLRFVYAFEFVYIYISLAVAAKFNC